MAKGARKYVGQRSVYQVKAMACYHGNICVFLQDADLSQKLEKALNDLKIDERIQEDFSVGKHVLISVTASGERKFRRAAIDMINANTLDATDLDSNEYYGDVDRTNVYSIAHLADDELIGASEAEAYYVHGYHSANLVVNPRCLGKVLKSTKDRRWVIQKTGEFHAIDEETPVIKLLTESRNKPFEKIIQIRMAPRRGTAMPPLYVNEVEEVQVLSTEKILGVQLRYLPLYELRRLEVAMTEAFEPETWRACDGSTCQPGDLVAAYYSGRRVRGFVVEARPGGARVYLMDYGLTEKFRYQKLWQLPEDLAFKLPRYGLRVQLAEEPADFFDDCLIEVSLEAAIDDSTWRGSILKFVEADLGDPLACNVSEAKGDEAEQNEADLAKSGTGVDGGPDTSELVRPGLSNELASSTGEELVARNGEVATSPALLPVDGSSTGRENSNADSSEDPAVAGPANDELADIGTSSSAGSVEPEDAEGGARIGDGAAVFCSEHELDMPQSSARNSPSGEAPAGDRNKSFDPDEINTPEQVPEERNLLSRIPPNPSYSALSIVEEDSAGTELLDGHSGDDVPVTGKTDNESDDVGGAPKEREILREAIEEDSVRRDGSFPEDPARGEESCIAQSSTSGDASARIRSGSTRRAQESASEDSPNLEERPQGTSPSPSPRNDPRDSGSKSPEIVDTLLSGGSTALGVVEISAESLTEVPPHVIGSDCSLIEASTHAKGSMNDSAHPGEKLAAPKQPENFQRVLTVGVESTCPHPEGPTKDPSVESSVCGGTLRDEGEPGFVSVVPTPENNLGATREDSPEVPTQVEESLSPAPEASADRDITPRANPGVDYHASIAEKRSPGDTPDIGLPDEKTAHGVANPDLASRSSDFAPLTVERGSKAGGDGDQRVPERISDPQRLSEYSMPGENVEVDESEDLEYTQPPAKAGTRKDEDQAQIPNRRDRRAVGGEARVVADVQDIEKVTLLGKLSIPLQSSDPVLIVQVGNSLRDSDASGFRNRGNGRHREHVGAERTATAPKRSDRSAAMPAVDAVLVPATGSGGEVVSGAAIDATKVKEVIPSKTPVKVDRSHLKPAGKLEEVCGAALSVKAKGLCFAGEELEESTYQEGQFDDADDLLGVDQEVAVVDKAPPEIGVKTGDFAQNVPEVACSNRTTENGDSQLHVVDAVVPRGEEMLSDVQERSVDDAISATAAETPSCSEQDSEQRRIVPVEELPVWIQEGGGYNTVPMRSDEPATHDNSHSTHCGEGNIELNAAGANLQPSLRHEVPEIEGIRDEIQEDSLRDRLSGESFNATPAFNKPCWENDSEEHVEGNAASGDPQMSSWKVRDFCEYPKASVDTGKVLRARVDRIVNTRNLLMTSDVILASIEKQLNSPQSVLEAYIRVGKTVLVEHDNRFKRACIAEIRRTDTGDLYFVYMLDYPECTGTSLLYKCPPAVAAMPRALLFVRLIGTQTARPEWIGHEFRLAVDRFEGPLIFGIALNIPSVKHRVAE